MPKVEKKGTMPKQPSKEAMPPPSSMSEDAGFRSNGRGRAPVKDADGAPDNMDPRRKSLYDRFNADQANASGQPDPASKRPENPDTPPAEGDTDTPSEKELPLDPVADAEMEDLPELPGDHPKEVDVTPTAGDKKDPVKVPLAALHEERTLHKVTKERLKTLEQETMSLRGQLNEVLQDFKKMVDGNGVKKPDPIKEIPDGPIDDIEAEIKRLRAETKRLNAELELDRQHRKSEFENSAKSKLEADVRNVASELEKEGYPGFNEFADKVGDWLINLKKTNEKLALQLDTPAGWKRIYKEKVFPKFRGVFSKKEREEGIANKTRLKRDAGLGGSPGSGGSSEPEQKKTWSHSDYLTWRRKSGTS